MRGNRWKVKINKNKSLNKMEGKKIKWGVKINKNKYLVLEYNINIYNEL